MPSLPDKLLGGLKKFLCSDEKQVQVTAQSRVVVDSTKRVLKGMEIKKTKGDINITNNFHFHMDGSSQKAQVMIEQKYKYPEYRISVLYSAEALVRTQLQIQLLGSIV